MSFDAEPSTRQIGRYELLASLGKGGMGQVFRARLTGPGGASKPVALKLIHSHLTGQESFTRLFLEELRIAMALNHRNIVQTFDGGEIEGRQYLVMELVPGFSLAELLKRTGQGATLPVDIALFVGMEVCAALDYGHTFQPEHTGHPGRVLHRDVSPTNILVSNQGDVKLTDYGVAKAAGSLALTSPDLIKGKLSYMAPEQARGQPSVQSDLFALGAVLYQMLARRPIREQVNLMDVREGKPEIAPLASLRPDLPRSLVALLTGCLANREEDRPESAWALREALAAEAARLHQGPDLHGRMRSFFGDVSGDRPASADSAIQLAQVMLQRAQAMPTDPGALAKGVSGGITGHGTESTVLSKPSRRSSVRPAHRRRWVVTAGLLFTAAGLALLWLWVRTPDAQDDRGVARAPVRAPTHAPDRGVTQSPDRGSAGMPALAPATPDASRSVTDLRPPDDAAPDHRPARQETRRRRQPGWLNLNSVPWAKVYIDGAYKGETPIQQLALPAGRHRVRLVNPAMGLSTSLVVRVPPRRTVTQVVNLRQAK